MIGVKESRDIAQIQPPEAADRRVGLESVTHRALLEIEAQLADDGPVQQDDRLGARRVAAVLHAVFGVGHRFGQRNQNRHVFRAVARHHAGDGDAPYRRGAAVRKKNSEHVFGISIGETQERLDLCHGGRDDGQSIAPLALVEMLVDPAGNDRSSLSIVLIQLGMRS
jgi:hypothetical protein